jgi:outer membrane protein OmpA-like peptidoglycan-associated protein
MNHRALILALMATGAVLPVTTRAADDCSQMFVYSVNQFCRTLSNGFSQCQPVGMVGPAPNCAKPGVPPIMPVPLAPPILKAPSPYNFMAPFPAPGSVAPSAAAQPTPAVPAAAPVGMPAVAAKPEVPKIVATVPSTPVTAVPPAPVVVPAPTPAPAVAVTPAPRQEPVAAPIAAPVAIPSTPAVAAPAKVEVTPPVSVAVPVVSPVQPVPVSAAPVASLSPATVPATPPSITLQDGLTHFGFDRAELSGQSRAELDAWLKQPLPKGKTLRVTGHADRLGPAPYNMKLSGRRAETVKKYLVGKGVDKQDIKVVAKGETEPVKHCKGGATKATIACLAPNRRVEIDPE